MFAKVDLDGYLAGILVGDIGIEHHAHQALSAFLLARRSVRTSKSLLTISEDGVPVFAFRFHF